METTKTIDTSLAKIIVGAIIFFLVSFFAGMWFVNLIVDNGIQNNINTIVQAKKAIKIDNLKIIDTQKDITSNSGTIQKAQYNLKTKYNLIYN